MIVNTGMEKLLALKHLLENKYADAKALIFCNTVQSSERLAALFGYTHISSGSSEKDKKRIIAKFVKGSITRIVATDQLSRGMDLEADLIVEFDCSRVCETYIHRVGRTARAGNTGNSVSILKKSQVSAFKQMMKPVASIRALKYST